MKSLQLLHICTPPLSQPLSVLGLHQPLSILLLFAFHLICLYLYYSLFLFDCITPQNVAIMYKSLPCTSQIIIQLSSLPSIHVLSLLSHSSLLLLPLSSS
jgi:hypothetical protein